MKLLAASGLLLVSLAGAQMVGLRVNTSASMPVGLWRVVPVSAELLRGEIVTVCPPDSPALRDALVRGYLPAGSCPSGHEPLVKPVAAVGGDLVTVDRDGVRVNGDLVAGSVPLDRDSAGRVLQGLPHGVYPVANGAVWLLSGHDAKSWDSRYFGAVPVKAVQAVARPVWVR